MCITFGVFLLILGLVLLVVGVARTAFSRSSKTASWKYATVLGGIGIVLVAASFIMLHHGSGRGVERVPIGILVILAGMVLMGVGTWLALWAPIAFRNTMGGWKFILLGLGIVVCGIVVLTFVGDLHFSPHRGVRWTSFDLAEWGHVFSRCMGPIPFGAFAAVVLIATNGFGLRRGLGLKAILGANIIIVAALVLLYALGPQLFHRW